MLKGIFLLDEYAYNRIYGPEERQQIQELVDLVQPVQTRQTIAQDPAVLQDVEVIFSGWGCPQFTEEFLNQAPKLKAVFYGSGSIRYMITEAFWDKNIIITTAYETLDIPVAEFTLAQILLSLKGYWQHVRYFKETNQWWDKLPFPGVYGSVVGLISLGMVGRMVAEHLKRFEVQVIAYDPFTTPETAAQYHVEMCSLDEIFRRADVVSLHTPWLPETEGMITGAHLTSMKKNATFINTARGAVVLEAEMAAVLQERTDLYALLDVTYPEPPAPDSPLLTLPNVILTPHMAGANEVECKRMGKFIVEELKRYLNCEPLHNSISRERFANMA